MDTTIYQQWKETVLAARLASTNQECLNLVTPHIQTLPSSWHYKFLAILFIPLCLFIAPPTHESWYLQRTLPLASMFHGCLSLGASFWRYRSLFYEAIVMNPLPWYVTAHRMRTPGFIYQESRNTVDLETRGERLASGVARDCVEVTGRWDPGWFSLSVYAATGGLWGWLFYDGLRVFADGGVVGWACTATWPIFLGPLLGMAGGILSIYTAQPYKKNYTFRLSARPRGLEIPESAPVLSESNTPLNTLLSAPSTGPIPRVWKLHDNPYPRTELPDRAVAYAVVSVMTEDGKPSPWDTFARALSLLSPLVTCFVVYTTIYVPPSELITLCVTHLFAAFITRLSSVSMISQSFSKTMGRVPVHHIPVYEYELESVLRHILSMPLQIDINGRVFTSGVHLAGYFPHHNILPALFGFLASPFDIRNGVTDTEYNEKS